ncbi:FAD-containing oxidoreductase [Streptococcus pacificus]|uniref:FAD-containing oxidoreductase n=1 Tax=Streptococcus pacificus TaxID=2740577 RepID=A0ABS0ZJY7_9STRE|nr:FAD-containing oxidoreductase [Streptococcus pacificus]MBJ8325846.1 FAD-containing oxidoreductase [Streptococcus pacificus]
MKHYDFLIIGFGQAGRPLASQMVAKGKTAAIVEQDPMMYGGTCINIGCVPTKTMIADAHKKLDFKDVMDRRNKVTAILRNGSANSVKNSGMDLYLAKAHFVSNKVVELVSDQETLQVTADVIVINTGAKSRVLDIPGLLDTKNVVDSTGLQELKEQPKTLGIIGGGNIGLEMTHLFTQMGTKVTIFEHGPKILGRMDDEFSQLAQTYMEEDGVTFKFNAGVEAVKNQGDQVILTADGKDYLFDVVMYAAGRVPNTDGLGLENTDIKLTERGGIKVDDYCQTTVPNVYALGDVRGDFQFTYISYDDYRIVYSHLMGDNQFSLSKRQNIPTATFINPTLASIGLTETMAKEQGLPYKANSLKVENTLRAYITNDFRGLMKVVVNKETDTILGATIFSEAAHEIINLLKMAMDHNIPYTYIKDQIFTHPTMAENLNNVFNF